MKKVLVTVLIGVLALAGYQVQADTNSVYSPNIVGFVKVNVTADGLIQAAPAFNVVGTGTNDPVMTLDQTFGYGSNTALIAFFTSSGADEAYLWNGSSYALCWLNDDGWSDSNINWRWVYDNEGYPAPCAGNSAYDIKCGNALWLLHKSTTTNFYLTGEVPSAQNLSRTLLGGLNMIAGPYPVTNTLDSIINTNTAGVLHFSIYSGLT